MTINNIFYMNNTFYMLEVYNGEATFACLFNNKI